jgi:hypothetical protein
VTQALAVIVLLKQNPGGDFIILDSGKHNLIEYKNLTCKTKYVFKSSNAVIEKIKESK